ncbi:hypothetical protein K402DRAFT_417941 [Aulographum hederae CBS 113979]|uniref:Uncharacterized protein n=1 Tax=Aulographum hederae CBS 113979 TaxID=1176131 RepID=A0A6G1HBB6_9PEZI|nr:hypothetical protein K402DRAFT_417941 [Aulographum hederae CBS 113979]
MKLQRKNTHRSKRKLSSSTLTSHNGSMTAEAPSTPSTPRTARPDFERQRSNSVPTIGTIDFTAAEGAIIFSAAERAATRRRKNVSITNPPVPRIRHTVAISPPDAKHISSSTSEPDRSATRQKLLAPWDEDTGFNHIDEDVSLDLSSWPLPNHQLLPSPNPSTNDNTPMPSPTKQSSPAMDLKMYRANVASFTRMQMKEVVPAPTPSTSPRAQNRRTMIFERQRNSQQAATASPPRPQLQSRFSGWSTATQSLATTPADLISEDPFTSTSSLAYEPSAAGSRDTMDSAFHPALAAFDSINWAALSQTFSSATASTSLPTAQQEKDPFFQPLPTAESVYSEISDDADVWGEGASISPYNIVQQYLQQSSLSTAGTPGSARCTEDVVHRTGYFQHVTAA